MNLNWISVIVVALFVLRRHSVWLAISTIRMYCVDRLKVHSNCLLVIVIAICCYVCFGKSFNLAC